MGIVVWLSVIIVFLYTSGFSISLWKQKNKPGSIAVMMLSVAILVLQYISYIR